MCCGPGEAVGPAEEERPATEGETENDREAAEFGDRPHDGAPDFNEARRGRACARMLPKRSIRCARYSRK